MTGGQREFVVLETYDEGTSREVMKSGSLEELDELIREKIGLRRDRSRTSEDAGGESIEVIGDGGTPR